MKDRIYIYIYMYSGCQVRNEKCSGGKITTFCRSFWRRYVRVLLMSFLRAKYYCVSFVNNFLEIFLEFRSILDTRPPRLSCSVFGAHWISLFEHP